MGLTIHWEQKNRIAEKEDYSNAIFEMKEYAKQNKVKIEKESAGIVKNLKELGKNNSLELVLYEFINFNPHPDSEWVTVCYDRVSKRLIDVVEYKDQSRNYYLDSFFCKTQFAGVDTHIKVVEMLDILNNYIPLKVYDEGEYWETRNYEKLLKNFGQNMDLIKSISGMLKNSDFKKNNIMSAKNETHGWQDDYIDYKLKIKIKD